MAKCYIHYNKFPNFENYFSKDIPKLETGGLFFLIFYLFFWATGDFLLPLETPAPSLRSLKDPRAGDGAAAAGLVGWRLGPLDVEDEVVITEARHPSNSTGGILTAVEANEGKALGLASGLVLG